MIFYIREYMPYIQKSVCVNHGTDYQCCRRHLWIPSPLSLPSDTSFAVIPILGFIELFFCSSRDWARTSTLSYMASSLYFFFLLLLPKFVVHDNYSHLGELVHNVSHLDHSYSPDNSQSLCFPTSPSHLYKVNLPVSSYIIFIVPLFLFLDFSCEKTILAFCNI